MTTDYDFKVIQEFYQQLIEDHIHKDIVTVTFTKQNGATRVMQCTLNPDFIPQTPVDPDAPPKTKRVVKDNPEILRVYDIEENGWRSFRWDSVIGVQYTNGDWDE